MSCPAPERELVPFLAAGSLEPPERDAAAAHAGGCAECAEELRASRELFDGLRSLHLGADEAVKAAEGGPAPAHLADCARCRGEVEALRAVNRELAPSLRAASLLGRPWLGWAAALLVAVPAALYLGSQPADREEPVTRGGAARGPALAVETAVALVPGAPARLPRRVVLLEFPAPAPAAGDRLELTLQDPGGREQLQERDLVVAGGRGRIVLDVPAMAAGPWRLSVRRVDAQERERETLSFELAVPAS